MNQKFLQQIGRRARSELSRFRPWGIHYVVDEANWSLYWDARYITDGLRKKSKLRAFMTHDPWRLKKQIIHFGDRYLFLNGPVSRLHESNRILLTWFHGSPDESIEMRRTFDRLLEMLPRIERIVVSCEISREILRKGGIPDAMLTLIPLGVDLQRFHRVEEERKAALRKSFGIPEKSICIGSFQKDGAGWGEGNEPKGVKGPDIFLEVMRRLAERHDNLIVLLTGPARGYVKKGLEKMGIPYVHHYLDDYLQIVPYYQALDLYLIASRAEGGPKALLESWATGTPVVSTRTGMPADLIKERKNGLIADIDDVQGLAHAMEEMIENERLRAECTATALKDVRSFDWNDIAGIYYDRLYRDYLP